MIEPVVSESDEKIFKSGSMNFSETDFVVESVMTKSLHCLSRRRVLPETDYLPRFAFL